MMRIGSSGRGDGSGSADSRTIGVSREKTAARSYIVSLFTPATRKNAATKSATRTMIPIKRSGLLCMALFTPVLGHLYATPLPLFVNSPPCPLLIFHFALHGVYWQHIRATLSRMDSSSLSLFCRNCGETVCNEVAFCSRCGMALSEDQIHANLDRIRRNARVSSRSTALETRGGMVVVGVLGAFLLLVVFIASFVISVNFFPDSADSKTSVFTYLIVMTTACVAGLSGLSYLLNRLSSRYRSVMLPSRRRRSPKRSSR